LDDSELVIKDYSCALKRALLIQGRLYVTNKAMYFKSPLGTGETISFSEVTGFRKELTYFVPNAIVVITNQMEKSVAKEYFFGTILFRDKAFRILNMVWNNSKLEKPLDAEAVLNQIQMDQNQRNKEEKDAADGLAALEGNIDLGPEIEIIGQIFADTNPLAPLSTDTVYFKDPTTAAVANTTLKMSLRNFFHLYLSTPQFSTEIHTLVKDYDISIGNWSIDESKQYWARTLTFKTPVDSKFVKQPWADVTQVQRLILKSKKELWMDTTNSTSGVPFSDAFTVEAKFRVTAEQEKLVKLQLYVEMNWKKSINFMMKGVVEKSSINGASAMLRQWSDLSKQKTCRNFRQTCRR